MRKSEFHMKSFSVHTLGCKVNWYESEAISEQLLSQGLFRTAHRATGDLCIVNTCTVTQKAAMQSRQAVRKAIRGHPGAFVVVTGCYAQIAPEVFGAVPGVHCIVGNTFKDHIAGLINGGEVPAGKVTLVEDQSTSCQFQDMPVTRFGGRTRPFLKVQDGCNAFCAYCIVPYARGRSRSLAPEIVLRRVEELIEGGYSEIVLCGINLGRYGKDLRPLKSLLGLIRATDAMPGLKRLRLSSIEPTELSEELVVQLAKARHVCSHLHIPLQSGDDEVLRSMNRSYTSEFYEDLIHCIVRRLRGAAIGVDVLVGFPGETERAFENTCRLLERLPIAYLHVFPFSLQKKTFAATLPGRIRPEEIKARCRHVRAIGASKRRQFYERAIGSTCEVLVEGKRDTATGCLKGLTENYIPVLMEGEDALMNRLVQTRVSKVERGRVFGTYS